MSSNFRSCDKRTMGTLEMLSLELRDWDDTYVLFIPCIKYITNENILYSTGDVLIHCDDLNEK